MNDYCFSKEKLNSEYKYVKEKLDQENLPNNIIADLNLKIATLDDIRNTFKLKTYIKNLINLPTYDKNFNYKVAQEKLNKYVSKLQHEIIKNTYEYFLGNDFKSNDEIMSFYLSKKSILTYAKETFLSIGGNSKKLDIIMGPKNNLLFLSNRIIAGLFYPYGKKGYILSYDTDNINSFCCLNHELGHYYEHCIHNLSKINDEKTFLYSEVLSIFNEHIGLDILKKHNVINDNDILEIQRCILLNNINTISNYFDLRFLVNKDNKNISEKAKIHMYKNAIEDASYYYSYIIAINFYYQYQCDPILAIKNLNHLFRKIDNNNEEKVLKESDIDISSNVLKKHLNKLKRNN